MVDPARPTLDLGQHGEDGNLYRWDLATDTLTQSITLTSGVGEAYTPTLVVAPNGRGTYMRINDAVLFSVVPEPSTLALVGLGAAWDLLLARS